MYEKRERVKRVVEGVREEWEGRLAEVSFAFASAHFVLERRTAFEVARWEEFVDA